MTACGSGEEQKVVKEKYVKTYQVSSATSDSENTYNGSIKEKSLTAISFRVAGPVLELEVVSGDFVKKGDVIAKIDPRDYQLQLQSAEAQYKQAKSEYERYKVLADRKTIPQNTFERVESGYLLAKTAYENAVNQLEDTELIAPFDGYVFEKFAEQFQTVNIGEPIMSLVDLSHAEVVISISESQLKKFKQNPKSYVSINDIGLDRKEIKLLSIAEKAAQDGTYEIKYVLNDPSKYGVLPGMTAELSIEENNNTLSVLSIPISALFTENNANYVWVYNKANKKINKRKIEVAEILEDGKINVVSGLKPQEIIISAGVFTLSEGQSVKPLKAVSKSNIGGLL